MVRTAIRSLSMVLLAGVLIVAAPGAGEAQQSRCADCRFSRPDAPGERHLSDWDLSAHGRAGVGCETCHAGSFVAFQKSRHYALVRGGSREAPTCVTCHGEVAARLLSPKSFKNTCTNCHGAGKPAQDTDHPPEGRMKLEGIRDARAMLKEARSVIGRVADPQRRAALEADAQQAEVPLVEATNAGHAFVFEGLQERLGVARERIAALYTRLINPPQR